MTNPNDPAYPVGHAEGMASLANRPGLTKREYFAALAMQGLLAYYGGEIPDERIGPRSLVYADLLIAELSK